MSADDAMDAGRAALEAGRWQEAREAFESVLTQGDSPEACAGLADATWWIGDTRRSLEWRERSYTGYRRAGDAAGAADAAIRLSVDYGAEMGNQAAAQGWMARAERMVAELPEGPLHGWLALLQANGTADTAEARTLVDRALALAREGRDADLELCALSELGMLQVRMGDVDAGFRCIDEAMAGALAGESGRLDTVVYTGCTMLTACDLVSDLQRARQWCRVADEFTRQYGGPFLYALCRVVYGRILMLAGQWREADRELARAVAATKGAYPAMHARALASLADLRLRQGRVEEAEALVEEVADPLSTAFVSAAIALRRGQPAVAAALLERSLGGEGGELTMPVHAGGSDVAPETIPELDLLVEARISLGELDDAAGTAERLTALAPLDHSGLAAAHAALAAGRVLEARGDAGAVPRLEEAIERFARLELPLETARVRLALARSLSIDRPDVAVVEARAALAGFERLGAAAEADAAAALLRSWGAGGRTGPRDAGLLSQREREVLALLGEGLSNQEIGERLYISRRTAAHHVSSVLSKLGVRNRAEAAAYAARTDAGAPSPPA